ncbi:MAG: MATE family efflux transporter, partial [Acetatifactor sp.]|nr:MATE family efflux transporter [Acetatifactor sp.]
MSEEKITWPSFLKLMMTIAFPVALQNLLSTTAGMVDTIMIGSLGEQAVAAVGICSQISSLFFSCYWGFAGGAMLFFAQYWGAKNERGINQTFGVTFLFMAVVGALFAVTAVTNPEFMLGIYT